MEFIDFQALVDNDVSEEEKIDEVIIADVNFIDDNFQQPGSSRNFYRKFENVTRDISEPIDDIKDWLDKRDLQLEMFWTKDQFLVKSDKFNSCEEKTKKN